MDTVDWRTQLQPDSRHRIANKILDTLKKHRPLSGPEGLHELGKIAERFEEMIYTTATCQSDHIRRISKKMVAIETKPPNIAPNISLPSNNQVGNKRKARASEATFKNLPPLLVSTVVDSYFEPDWKALCSKSPLEQVQHQMQASVSALMASIASHEGVSKALGDYDREKKEARDLLLQNRELVSLKDQFEAEKKRLEEQVCRFEEMKAVSEATVEAAKASAVRDFKGSDASKEDLNRASESGSRTVIEAIKKASPDWDLSFILKP